MRQICRMDIWLLLTSAGYGVTKIDINHTQAFQPMAAQLSFESCAAIGWKAWVLNIVPLVRHVHAWCLHSCSVRGCHQG